MSDWISITDEMPKIGNMVICTDGLITWIDEVSLYWIECAIGSEFCVNEVVTHWMPLPEPPKN